MQSVPLLMCMGLVLYVDRVVRQESIFDSSALTCTIFVAHVINVCRSSIMHVDEEYYSSISSLSMRQSSLSSLSSVPSLLQYSGPLASNGSSLLLHDLQQQPAPILLPNRSMSDLSSSYSRLESAAVAPGEDGVWWELSLLYSLYAAASILLQLDVDVVSMLLPPAHCSLAHVPATEHGAQVARRRKRGSSSSSSPAAAEDAAGWDSTSLDDGYQSSVKHLMGGWNNLGGVSS